MAQDSLLCECLLFGWLGVALLQEVEIVEGVTYLYVSGIRLLTFARILARGIGNLPIWLNEVVETGPVSQSPNATVKFELGLSVRRLCLYKPALPSRLPLLDRWRNADNPCSWNTARYRRMLREAVRWIIEDSQRTWACSATVGKFAPWFAFAVAFVK
jgi:hypothetical protein